VDFFSIGSNDLLQYFMAADRANSKVAALYDPLQPAFLRFLRMIVEAARRQGRWIGLCGEMGGQTRLLPLLVGLNLDEVSATIPAIPALKAGLASLNRALCHELLLRAEACATAGEVAALLKDFATGGHVPLFSPDLILSEVEAETKEEAIKQAVDLLYVHDRLDQPRLVEEAVWEREAAYSTGFGHGFAIPHCKSAAVRSNSLVFLRLRQPVHWGSLDDQPVRVVILLAIRDADGADAHMKVFARLARQVMHGEVRETIAEEKDSAELCAFLHHKLGL
jgi:fructose-specific PTS system IIA-like component